MSNRRIILSMDAVAIAVVILIMLAATAKSSVATQPSETGQGYVDLR